MIVVKEFQLMDELNSNQHHTLSNSLKLKYGKGIFHNCVCQYISAVLKPHLA